jgi:CBS domain-containing protein
MSTGLITAPPTQVLSDAFETFQSERIRHLPVVEGDELLGIVSSRDLFRVADSPAPRRGFELLEERTVADVMTKRPLHTVGAGTSVREAIELMCREKVSALPVLQGKKLVGIVTSEDLLWSVLETPEE